MTVPFLGKEFTFVNPDGTEIRVRGWGDQFHAVFETLDGFTVVEDPATGYYHYARLFEDKSQFLPSGAKVGEVNPLTLELTPHLRVRQEAARVAGMSARTSEGERRWEVRRRQKKSRPTSPFRQPAGPGAAPPPGTTVGTYVGLCLLIQFPDVSGTITQQQVNDFCNEVGIAGSRTTAPFEITFTTTRTGD